MFRRKDEGTETAETNVTANPEASTAEVLVPPAPQGQSDTNSLLYGSASSYSTPATGSTAYGSSPAEPKPATTGSSPSSAYASPYRATTGSASAGQSGSTGSNVTELSGRSSASSSRYADNATRTGTSSMEKPAKSASSKNRILTVGNDILMKGEINSCDRIVIEGAVDATLKEVHTMEIAETGSFKGVAEVEEAEISGSVEGDLTVRGRLIIYATGKVSGKISYGEIEVERGGQITGEIKTAGASGANNMNKAAA